MVGDDDDAEGMNSKRRLEALSGDTCSYLSAKSIRSIRSLLLSGERKL